MNMKTRFIIVLSILVMVSSAFAGEKEFGKGQLFLTPQFAYYSYAPNFGVSLEYGLTQNIGIGGSLLFAFWSDEAFDVKISESLITPSFDIYYHFTKVEVEKLDLFAGLSVGYSIYSYSFDIGGFEWNDAGSSNIYLSPILGIKYYLTSKLAISLRSHYSALGDWSGMGGELGLSFRLK
ncbi:MAG: outer membrane beta-barrel protein [Candidatus Aminicenantes bacterium]|nr:outer membrane beta-barrel protein [Candidatus Aminicenantes bacterium]NIM79922.1 outer membrane beta-barrel protein [Candidatus Aminicenantes bacterium]NIN19261.1 outer membrane beta-barrel protein [Candidatus Aminicenantes bacterium]NIN43164.1 outer membrane beta-barrel protein [Candidatus Aminicenantes bacterium]NIN85903.1 outer membrane beta-barrel protein [Candidatus Aminicenantes bacterium]